MCRELRVHSSDTNRHDQAKNKHETQFLCPQDVQRFSSSKHTRCVHVVHSSRTDSPTSPELSCKFGPCLW
jgi:hypothetical protein